MGVAWLETWDGESGLGDILGSELRLPSPPPAPHSRAALYRCTECALCYTQSAEQHTTCARPARRVCARQMVPVPHVRRARPAQRQVCSVGQGIIWGLWRTGFFALLSSSSCRHVSKSTLDKYVKTGGWRRPQIMSPSQSWTWFRVCSSALPLCKWPLV